MIGQLRSIKREMPAAVIFALLALLANFLVAQTHRQIGHWQAAVVNAGDRLSLTSGEASLSEDCPLCAAVSGLDPITPSLPAALTPLFVEKFVFFHAGAMHRFVPSRSHGWNSRAPPRG